MLCHFGDRNCQHAQGKHCLELVFRFLSLLLPVSQGSCICRGGKAWTSHTPSLQTMLKDSSRMSQIHTDTALLIVYSISPLKKNDAEIQMSLSAQLDGIFLRSRDFFSIFYYFSSGWRVWFKASVITIITLSGWHISMVPITVIETLGPLHHSSFTPRLLLICPNKI